MKARARVLVAAACVVGVLYGICWFTSGLVTVIAP